LDDKKIHELSYMIKRALPYSKSANCG